MTGTREPVRSVRWLVRRVATIFYRIDRAGPTLPDGPVLVLANHPNALLDGAIVWATAGRDLHFLAKSTLFGVPGFGWLMRRAGAVPTYRRIDASDTGRNVEMFRAVAAALTHGAAVCLFPEGVSHSSGRLQPLKTGAARIALDAVSRGVPLAIVPAGLDFVRKWAFRSRVTVTFGEPFRVDPADAAAGPEPGAVQRLTTTMARRLRAVIVEADPFTDAVLVDRVDRLYTAARLASRRPADRVDRRRVIAAGIARLRAADPDRYDAIRSRVLTYNARLRRFGLRNRDLDLSVAPGAVIRFALRETLIALLLGPLGLAGLSLFGAPYAATGWISRRLEQEPDVVATGKTFVGAAVYVAWTAALAGVAFALHGWAAALATAILTPVAAMAVLAALEREAAVWATVRAWFAARGARDRARRYLRRDREEIVEVLEEVYRWVTEKK